MRRINPAAIAGPFATYAHGVEADMGIEDIVQLNMLLIERADRDGAMAVRDAELGAHRPASTLMYISGLANPAWKIEIDFIAAKESDDSPAPAGV